MAAITAMSTRGQIVLPKKIRTALKLDAGTQFIVFSDEPISKVLTLDC